MLIGIFRPSARARYRRYQWGQAFKKWGVGAAGAGAVALSFNASQSQAPSVAPPISSTADGPFDSAKPHDRWPIKTSIASSGALAQPIPERVTVLEHLKDFKPTLPEPSYSSAFIKGSDIPSSVGLPAGLQEGQTVQTEGYVHLVAFEVDDDSDYHIQINEAPTNDPADLNKGCLIVEVPHPDATNDPQLKAEFAAAREFLRHNCFTDKTPSGTVQSPIHVRVTGQLFYDLYHSLHGNTKDPGGGRGKKVGNTVMHATTIWELHPVTKIELIP